MMPVIRISDSVFERLQTLATPLVDTPASVIEKLLDFYESQQGKRKSVPVPPDSGPVGKAFNADTPPDLHYTRVLLAQVDGQTASNWNELVYVAHRCAMSRLKSFDAVRSATQSSIAPGRRSDRGFHYLPDVNLSIQNVDANLAWRNALNLARRLGVSIRVEFEWRHNEGAAQPGQRGSVSWAPVESDVKARA